MKLHKLYSCGKVVGYQKVYNFREIEDPEKFNAYDSSITIELDHCPFCGNTTILNQDSRGWFGNCMICGTKGPSHWDWRRAAKMWNDRSLKTVIECNEIKIENWEGFDFTRILPEQREKAGIVINETT